MVNDARGQLILIGSIAIALILVGLVLVVNTALFTEVVGSEGTVETTKEGGVATQELEDAVSAVAHDATIDETTSTVDYVVEDELRPVLANSSVDSRGAFVNVTYLGSPVDGTYVHQNTPDEFDDDFDPDGSSVDVGHFVLVIEDADDMEIDVEGTGGTTETLDIDAFSNSVELSDANSSSACSGFEATDGTVRIDLYNGRVYEAPGCTFDLFGPPEAPYDHIETNNGGDVEGTFQLVTDHDNPLTYDRYDADQAIWSYDFAYEYDTGEVTVEGEREVNVYD